MRGILNKDVIVQITPSGKELGPKPYGSSLESLRYNGKKIVDLGNLTGMWIEKKRDGFVLHCMNVGNCQYVKMLYNQKHLLIDDNGTYRLKTKDEIQSEKKEKKLNRKQAIKRTFLKKYVGDRYRREEYLEDLIRILIKAVIEKDTESIEFLTNYLNKTQNMTKNSEEMTDIIKIAEKKDLITSTIQDQFYGQK